jgi:SAM-dependent methyltransferase
MTDQSATISRLIKQAWAHGDPTGWFEAVYANAASGQGSVPWAHMQPTPDLIEWLEAQQIDGAGQRALVVGCGLGDDAQALAERDFAVTAFDISETAVAWCRERFPHSSVDYCVADLLNAPAEWRQAYDFVLENRTVQSLPHDLAEPALAAIASFVAPSGTLLVLCHGRDPHEDRRGIPWPLSHHELAALTQHGLTETTFEDYTRGGLRQFRAVYRRNG